MITFASRRIKLLNGLQQETNQNKEIPSKPPESAGTIYCATFSSLARKCLATPKSMPLKCFGNCHSAAEPPTSWFWSSFLLWFLNLWWTWCNQNSVQSNHPFEVIGSCFFPHLVFLSFPLQIIHLFIFYHHAPKDSPLPQLLKMIQKKWYLALLKLIDIPALPERN